MLKLFLLVMGASILILVADRILLRMEAAGWIYYRKRKPKPGSFGNAFLEIHRLLEPSKEYVIQVDKAVRQEQANPGDPKSPGSRAMAPDCPGQGEGGGAAVEEK